MNNKQTTNQPYAAPPNIDDIFTDIDVTGETIDFTDIPDIPAERVADDEPKSVTGDKSADDKVEIEVTKDAEIKDETVLPAVEPDDDKKPTDDKITDEKETTEPEAETLTDEEEAHAKTLPKNQREPFRNAIRDAKMQRSFLNPNSPADVWVENLQKKSPMRFNEIESELLKKNLSGEPEQLLSKIYQNTADENGNSQALGRLIEHIADEHQDFIKEILESKGQTIAPINETNNQTASEDYETFVEENKETLHQFADFFPNEAEKLHDLLKSATAAKTENETAEKQVEELLQKYEADQLRQTTDRAAQAATFGEVYDEVTSSAVSQILDKTLGLSVSDAERKANPLMAFVKDAKRALLLAGSFDGDFDRDLAEYGKGKPAFVEAMGKVTKFVQAGEKRNAQTAANELSPFIQSFLQENRMKSPQLAFIDEIIEIIKNDQELKASGVHQFAPSSHDRAATRSAGETSLDNMFLDI